MPNISKIKDNDTGVVYDIEDTVARSMAGGLSADVKAALLACFEKVAWIDANGQDYYDDLYDALYPPANLVSISAVYTQSGVVYDTSSLNSLKSDLVVTANYSDSTTKTIDNYVLSGTLTAGTSTITVTYGGKTDTFTVNVSSLYMYNLSSPFTSTGSNAIDTGVAYSKNQTYTILCDLTRTGTTTTVSYIYGNKKNGQSQYLALQSQNAYIWGMGITYQNGNNCGPLDNNIRTAAVVKLDDAGHASISMRYKNVTSSGSIRSFNNTYTNIDFSDTSLVNNITLGDSEGAGTGFLGTIHEFIIVGDELSTSDMDNFLNTGAL